MKVEVLKNYLIQIADKLTPESTLEDVYEHLSLLSDIDESERDELLGNTFTQEEVKKISSEWLK